MPKEISECVLDYDAVFYLRVITRIGDSTFGNTWNFEGGSEGPWEIIILCSPLAEAYSLQEKGNVFWGK